MCVSPKTFKRDNGEIISVPCGRCYQCVRKRKMEWEIRIRSEMSVSTCAFFSLLSYNPENLPNPPVADKRAIQLLIRRLRRVIEYDYGKDVKLKYFIVSEYGEERNRLHYHAIFFIKGIYLDRFQWKTLLETEWGKGFCSAYELASNWIHYCVKYMQKSYNMMLASRLGYDAYYDSLSYPERVTVINKGKNAIVNKMRLYPYYDRMDYPKFAINGKLYNLPRSWYEKGFDSAIVSHLKRNYALNNPKELNQVLKEYEKQMNFLHYNPDCAEKERVKYDASAGLNSFKQD